MVKGEKVRLIHDMRRNGTNSKVTFKERLVLPRVKDIIEGVMELLERKNNREGVEFLTLDFRDAFKQLHVVPSERRFLTGAAMGGPLVWGQLGSCVAPKRGWPKTGRTLIVLWTTPHPVERYDITKAEIGNGRLVVVEHFGAEVGVREGVIWSSVVWIGTQFEVNSKVNKVEIRLPVKKNVELLEALAHSWTVQAGW